MKTAKVYNNDELELEVGETTYTVSVHATGTYWYRKATRIDPEENDFDIDYVEAVWKDSNGNIVEETPEMHDVLEEYLFESDGWDDEEYEPDYDYYEECAIERWERQLDRYDLQGGIMILGIALCWVFAITMFLIVKYFWWKNNGEDDDKQPYIFNLADNRKGEH